MSQQPFTRLSAVVLLLCSSAALPAEDDREVLWIAALDEDVVTRSGDWKEGRFRYAAVSHLYTTEDRSALELTFEGSGVAVRLGGHSVPAYGPPNQGALIVTVDGKNRRELSPLDAPREIVLARGLSNGVHRLRLEHRVRTESAGCRVEGFRVWSQPCGELQFNVNGEENAFLVDVRAILRRGNEIICTSLLRNWLTGRCSITAVPTGEGYSLEIRACGWKPVEIENIRIHAKRPTVLSPIYLRREESTVIRRFRFPALGRPAIRRPGETFRARFLGFDAAIGDVLLTRRVGPAVISRKLQYEEDEAAAYYYDREIIARLPEDIPAGVYDLSVQVDGSGRTGLCRSPGSLHVVNQYPADPVFVTFGHLDTFAQYQAEYLQRLVSMANLIAPDMALNANAVNAAYISGAMSRLDAPYMINFGNHQFPGHEAWYGDPVNIVDFGRDLCILNFGHPWHVDTSKADALLSARQHVRMKIINSFEQNAPLELLDRHGVCMLHDAHGTGKKVMDMGATPTRRIGKTNATSFRVVRLKAGRVESCTYEGHDTDPYPFDREQTPPLRVTYSPANDGTQQTLTATIRNDYAESFPNGRLTFVLPKGEYTVDQGRLESTFASDDNCYSVVNVRVDIPRHTSFTVRVRPNR